MADTSAESTWKREYEQEYARVFGKKIKLVGGRNGIYKMRLEGGLPSRSGYLQSDILRMTRELRSRPA
jgi:hypothetical protein